MKVIRIACCLFLLLTGLAIIYQPGVALAQDETEEKVECILAQSLAKGFPSIPGFGSSDCNCDSHLFWGTEKEKLRAGIIAAANQSGLSYTIDKG